MQKFTRPLTREIELGGERLALTFTEQGLAVRPVGSRRPPREVSWAALLYQLLQSELPQPGPDQINAALDILKKTPTSKASAPAPVYEPPTAVPVPEPSAAPPTTSEPPTINPE